MTAIDHHSMIGDSKCTNSTIAMVKCACAAAMVAAAVVALVLLQGNWLLERVAIPSLLLYSQKCSLCFPFPQASHPKFLFKKQVFSQRCFSVVFVQRTQ